MAALIALIIAIGTMLTGVPRHMQPAKAPTTTLAPDAPFSPTSGPPTITSLDSLTDHRG